MFPLDGLVLDHYLQMAQVACTHRWMPSCRIISSTCFDMSSSAQGTDEDASTLKFTSFANPSMLSSLFSLPNHDPVRPYQMRCRWGPSCPDAQVSKMYVNLHGRKNQNNLWTQAALQVGHKSFHWSTISMAKLTFNPKCHCRHHITDSPLRAWDDRWYIQWICWAHRVLWWWCWTGNHVLLSSIPGSQNVSLIEKVIRISESSIRGDTVSRIVNSVSEP